jgi:spore coat polysaccharide biosynthesis protein SpsF
MKAVCLIQARFNATRFPGKVLQRIDKEYSILEFLIKRITCSRHIKSENLLVLTSVNDADNSVADFLKSKNINFYRGNESNVFKRFYDFLELNEFKSDLMLRVCADNPFIEPDFIDALIIEAARNENKGYDYFSFSDKDGTPSILTHYGFFSELIRTESFIKTGMLNLSKYEKEHVTPVFYNNPMFRTFWLSLPEELQSMNIRCTVDTPDDLTLLSLILNEMNDSLFSYKDIIRIIRQKPWISDKMKELIESNAKK